MQCSACAGTTAPRPRTISVLSVDDRPEALYVRDRILRAQGFALTNSGSGRIGNQLARQLRPDVVLLDVVLKDGDGRELCRKMKADPATARIPVILISAVLTGDADEVECVSSGRADAFLKEPVEPEVLVSLVRRLTGATTGSQA